jgi:NAD(P)-dependent dehydrogenase (short-subunit alcohol dehydrogenase family)
MLSVGSQQINVGGVYLICEAYIASLGETAEWHADTIINVSSQIGLVEMPTTSAYAVSKLSVIKLTEMIAGGMFHKPQNHHSVGLIHCTEHHNIRVISVHPGIVPTALSSLGNLALDSVELVGSMNLYLASPRAAYLQGRYVTANWYVDELEAHKEEIISDNLLRNQLNAAYGDDGHTWKS